MSNVVALIPARQHSVGIQGKNLRKLGGKTLIEHAVDCAVAAGIQTVWVNVTVPFWRAPEFPKFAHGQIVQHWPRPLALDTSETPMFDVVAEMVKGGAFPSDDTIVCLLQPTAVFRTPAHIQTAVQMLREPRPRPAGPTHGVAMTEMGAVPVPLPELPPAHWDSVVSVVPLPLTHHPEFQCVRDGATVRPWGWWLGGDEWSWANVCSRRQDMGQTYIRDGTVYAFFVKTLRSGTLYGHSVRPLILDPSETCELDTEADWEAVQARWERQHGQRTA